MKNMTSRERMMITLRNGQPDRVPVAPDISNMIPCRITGKPFWEIYVNRNPPLWKAYLDAVKSLHIDGWFTYGDIGYKTKSQNTYDTDIVKYDDRWDLVKTIHTPEGDLVQRIAHPENNSPTSVEKIIKDMEKDFNKMKYLYPDITGYDLTTYNEQKKLLGEDGMLAVSIGTPGLHLLSSMCEGSLEAATYAYYDYPDLVMELFEMYEKQALQKLEIALDLKVDSILTGGSGSLTLQSPELWRKLSLPTLKKITKMCKEAGVISGVHCCGKEMYLLDTCAHETDLDYANPLEIPPMGDCDLKDCKEKYGDKLALMGNLNTTSVMLYGTVNDVRRESLKAILDAGAGGGFVLSTGDQCGRDTPLENIKAMVDVVEEYGYYPLDIERIQDEIRKLT